jgi:LexA-binding, inner membrane-associated putative hydrolase
MLMAAAMLADLIWPILLLTGVEHVRIRRGDTAFTSLQFTDYPWTHSLAMSLALSIVVAIVYWAITRYGRGALVAGVCVFSHWVLDWITHSPDLPLYPGGAKVGLGLWNRPVATIGVEAAMFAVGILIYRDTTKPRDRIGSVGMWLFIIFLAAVYVFNASGAPPPNERALAWGALAAWLLPLWAWWFDRHRDAGPALATAEVFEQ